MFATYIENYDLMDHLQKQADCVINRLVFFHNLKKKITKSIKNSKKFYFLNKKRIRRYCYRLKIKKLCRKMNKIFFHTSIIKLLKECEI